MLAADALKKTVQVEKQTKAIAELENKVKASATLPPVDWQRIALGGMLKPAAAAVLGLPGKSRFDQLALKKQLDDARKARQP